MSTYKVRIPFTAYGVAVVNVEAEDEETAKDCGYEAALDEVVTVSYEPDSVIHEDVVVEQVQS